MTDDIKEEKKKKKLTDKDPLTLEEIKAACDIFFPLFNAVKLELPDDTDLKDQIKIVNNKSITVLLRKNNNKETDDDAEFIFGFNKANKKEEETTDE